jgi:hypothetical protein
MKKLIVIGAYPNTAKKENILKREILSLKNIGFDIMVVSHYPVSSEIQNMIDYYIFDKNQTLTPRDISPYYWSSLDAFFIKVYNQSHGLPICQNMYNAFKFSEIKKYDFVYFSENDNVFESSDVLLLNSLLDEMILNNKKCIFFKPKNFTTETRDRSKNSLVYETQFFGITPSYFNRVFELPTNIDEWYNTQMEFTLELAFLDKLEKYESDFLIIDEHSSEYFAKSEINILRIENFIVELLYNIKDPSIPVLYYHNNSNENKHLVIKINDIIVEDQIIICNYWAYRNFTINNDVLDISVYDSNNEIEITKTYTLDKDINARSIINGIIQFT